MACTVQSKRGVDYTAVKLYLILSNEGAMTCAEIGDRMGLARTETYHLLTVLQNAALVTATFNPPIKFVAVPDGYKKLRLHKWERFALV